MKNRPIIELSVFFKAGREQELVNSVNNVPLILLRHAPLIHLPHPFVYGSSRDPMSQNNYVIAVDLGGTNLRVGAVSSKGKVEFLEKIPSQSKAKTSEALELIAASIQKVRDKIITEKKNIEYSE